MEGVKKEDIQAELKDGYLTISATHGSSKDEKDDNGKAILATLNAGYAMPAGVDVQLSVNYLMNDSNWYNNLAQSPQFFASRPALRKKRLHYSIP